MAKKNKYENLADNVIILVGGKGNIEFFTHCITRLRFNVKDQSIVNVNDIEKIEGVIGCQWQSGQLQIIIGQAVADAYKLICEKADLAMENGVEENLDKGTKKFSIGAIFDTISGCIAPILPILIGAGMIKVLILLGELIGILPIGSETHTVLSFVGDAGFYFLPIFVGGSAAKKFNANQYLGMLMGAMMIHPEFINLINNGESLSVFGIPMYASNYTYSIFTAILAVYVMAHVERFIAKYSPTTIRSITEPLFTIVIMIPLTLCLLAPLGAMIGVYFTDSVLWLYNTTGFLSIAILAAIIPFVVMTGMHAAFDPYLIQTIAVNGSEPIGGVVFFINNFNQGAASAAVAVCTKDANMKSIAASSAVTAIVGGVCEPAMYGVNLKLKKPMYGAMIGSAFAGAYIGLMNVYIYAYPGNAALFGIPTFIGPDHMNVINFLIGCTLGIIVTFIATIVMLKADEKKQSKIG